MHTTPVINYIAFFFSESRKILSQRNFIFLHGIESVGMLGGRGREKQQVIGWTNQAMCTVLVCFHLAFIFLIEGVQS